jgi:hypothetical protein
MAYSFRLHQMLTTSLPIVARVWSPCIARAPRNTSLAQAGYALSYSLAHLAVPYGGRQDARLEPKYIQMGVGSSDARLEPKYKYRRTL